jgi:hypothetical protein
MQNTCIDYQFMPEKLKIFQRIIDKGHNTPCLPPAVPLQVITIR